MKKLPQGSLGLCLTKVEANQTANVLIPAASCGGCGTECILDCADRAQRRRRFSSRRCRNQSGVALRLPPHSKFFTPRQSAMPVGFARSTLRLPTGHEVGQAAIRGVKGAGADGSLFLRIFLDQFRKAALEEFFAATAVQDATAQFFTIPRPSGRAFRRLFLFDERFLSFANRRHQGNPQSSSRWFKA